MKSALPFLLALLVLSSCKSVFKEQNTVPNVLLIVVDDLGWADLGCYGSTFYETPNIDQLAKDGIKFTNGYASCPVCSPSRASIQTGLYPNKTAITDWIPGRGYFRGAEEENRWLANEMSNELNLEFETIAEVLNQNNYQTFFTGKWHLGEAEEFWPEAQGYDINEGGYSKGSPQLNPKDSCFGYFSPYCNPKLSNGAEGEYLTDRLANETIEFLETRNNQPFLINFSLYQVHTPLQAKAAMVEKYEQKRTNLALDQQKELDLTPAYLAGNIKSNSFKERLVQSHPTYAAMIESMDANIGRIIATLKAKGLYDNTLIIFTSDNGGLSTSEGSPTTNAPLRAGKGWLYEGGIRVPFIIKKVNQIDRGTSSQRLASSIDVFPTILEHVAIKNPKKIDGIDVLSNRNKEERPLFWYYPHYSNQGGNPGAAIRKGKYKLIHDFETGEKLLFDLEQDLSEQNNLAQDQPQKLAELFEELQAWRKATNASDMRPNSIWNEAEVIVK